MKLKSSAEARIMFPGWTENKPVLILKYYNSGRYFIHIFIHRLSIFSFTDYPYFHSQNIYIFTYRLSRFAFTDYSYFYIQIHIFIYRLSRFLSTDYPDFYLQIIRSCPNKISIFLSKWIHLYIYIVYVCKGPE